MVIASPVVIVITSEADSTAVLQTLLMRRVTYLQEVIPLLLETGRQVFEQVAKIELLLKLNATLKKTLLIPGGMMTK